MSIGISSRRICAALSSAMSAFALVSRVCSNSKFPPFSRSSSSSRLSRPMYQPAQAARSYFPWAALGIPSWAKRCTCRSVHPNSAATTPTSTNVTVSFFVAMVTRGTDTDMTVKTLYSSPPPRPPSPALAYFPGRTRACWRATLHPCALACVPLQARRRWSDRPRAVRMSVHGGLVIVLLSR